LRARELSFRSSNCRRTIRAKKS